MAGFLPASRVTVVAGKGGVGKTTVAAALGLAAAQAGRRALVVTTDARTGLTGMFGRPGPLTYAGTTLFDAPEPGGGSVTARSLAPDEALVEYLDDHGMRRISRRLASTGTLEVIATAVPGIREILVLGKVKQLERWSASGEPGAPDCIVVDAPAAGHAVSLLASPHGLLDAASGGPIRAQAEAVVEMLADPARSQALLVTLAEETPVNETVETAYLLEDRAGVKLGPVVVNGVWPALDLPAATGPSADAARFRLEHQAEQAEQRRRLAELLPLPQVELPYLFTTDLHVGHLRQLAACLAAALPPVGP